MTVFTHKDFDGHERVAFFHDAATGLRAIIAVHNTNLGPALGGCRMWSYENDEAALKDVLRLSRGMTYKAAVAGLPLGGGKSVIIADPRQQKTPELLRTMGQAVDSFRGRYIIAEDVGTSEADMQIMRRTTDHVVGVGVNEGQVGGDPSPITAQGVYVGLKAAVEHRLQAPHLRGIKIAVQGLGNVGMNLCRLLAADGAQLFVTDMHTDRVDAAVRDLGAQPVDRDHIYAVDVDVFAPCALGGILSDQTIPQLKARVIAGAANNQLATLAHAEALQARQILYAPDYVVNAGGLMSVYYEYVSRTGRAVDRVTLNAHVEKIGSTLREVFLQSERDGISTALAADRVAEARFHTPAAPHPQQQRA